MSLHIGNTIHIMVNIGALFVSLMCLSLNLTSLQCFVGFSCRMRPNHLPEISAKTRPTSKRVQGRRRERRAPAPRSLSPQHDPVRIDWYERRETFRCWDGPVSVGSPPRFASVSKTFSRLVLSFADVSKKTQSSPRAWSTSDFGIALSDSWRSTLLAHTSRGTCGRAQSSGTEDLESLDLAARISLRRAHTSSKELRSSTLNTRRKMSPAKRKTTTIKLFSSGLNVAYVHTFSKKNN